MISTRWTSLIRYTSHRSGGTLKRLPNSNQVLLTNSLVVSSRSYSSKPPHKTENDSNKPDESSPSTSSHKRRLNAMSPKSKPKPADGGKPKPKSSTASKTRKPAKASENDPSSLDQPLNSHSANEDSTSSYPTTPISNPVNKTINDSMTSNPTKFIPIHDFPKAPESILNKSLKDLYASMNMTISEDELNLELSSTSPKREDTFVDFTIPDSHLKSTIKAQITEKDRAIVEGLDQMVKSHDDREIRQLHASVIKLYYDEDTNTYQPLPEHTLKKSLSGMINLNPHMEDIDDEYLWELFPKNKPFGKPPFEQNFNLNGFKNWEKAQLAHLKKEQTLKEDNKKEYTEFVKLLHENRSLFKKTAGDVVDKTLPANDSSTTTASGSTGKDKKTKKATSRGRKKLDRSLVKQYKKLKQEGKIPNDDDDKKF